MHAKVTNANMRKPQLLSMITTKSSYKYHTDIHYLSLKCQNVINLFKLYFMIHKAGCKQSEAILLWRKVEHRLF